MSKKRRIEGDMTCDTGFLVLPECLGEIYESRTPCFPLTVMLPRLDPSLHQVNLVAPFSAYRAEQDAADAAEARYAGDSAWGCAQTWRDNPQDWNRPITTSAVVERVRFVTEGKADNDDDFQHTLNHFARHQAKWWTRLADWIGVVSSQDLIRLGKNRTASSFEHLSMWLADPQDGQEPGFMKPNFGHIRGYCGNPLSTNQLATCMALAGNETPPPLAWMLIRDARSLLRSGEYRRAVLDIGTATELALTALLDERAPDALNDPKINKPVLTLGRLEVSSRRVDAEQALPDQLYERVIDPRNEATHEALPLTKDVAATVIATATELVGTAFPLSAFGLPAS